MYCKQCGAKMNENQAICVKCGVPVGKGNSYCAKCGSETDPKAVVCISCGGRIVNEQSVGIRINEKNISLGRTRTASLIIFLIIAALTTICLFITDYIWVYEKGYYYRYIVDYSFVEWFGWSSLLIILLVWANSIVSIVGINKRKNYSAIKIINTIVLLITVFAMTIDAGDVPGPMFGLTMLLILAELITSIILAIIGAVFGGKSTERQRKNAVLPIKLGETQSAGGSSSMFCKNCGTKMNANQAICIKCGVSVGNGNSYCPNCGKELFENAEFCMSCGISIKAHSRTNQYASDEDYLGGRDKMTMAMICIFFGQFGVHNFMMGEKKKGFTKIAFVLLFGFSTILTLIDFFKIVTDKYEIDPDKCF